MFATKILKVGWQGNSLNWLVNVFRYCYYVLATVYEISFICRTVHLHSLVNCQTPPILALSFTFNYNAYHYFWNKFQTFFVTGHSFFSYILSLKCRLVVFWIELLKQILSCFQLQNKIEVGIVKRFFGFK